MTKSKVTGMNKKPIDQTPIATKAANTPTIAHTTEAENDEDDVPLRITLNQQMMLTRHASTKYRAGKGHMGC